METEPGETGELNAPKFKFSTSAPFLANLYYAVVLFYFYFTLTTTFPFVRPAST